VIAPVERFSSLLVKYDGYLESVYVFLNPASMKGVFTKRVDIHFTYTPIQEVEICTYLCLRSANEYKTIRILCQVFAPVEKIYKHKQNTTTTTTTTTTTPELTRLSSGLLGERLLFL